MSGELKLKVCGMRDAENIRTIAAFQPDYMGFIFYDKSPRWVGQGFVIPEISANIERVGVFVNASNEEMLKAADAHKLSFLQLHGDESVDQVRTLANRGMRVWKAFALDEQFDFRTVEGYAPYVSMFVFDTKGTHYGGNSKTFDWAILQKFNQRVPFMLSGGLNAMNIPWAQQLEGMNLLGLDVNSGVESMPGVKDPEKLKVIIAQMRGIKEHD